MSVKQQVFGLEITVNDIVRMEIFQRKCHFGGVKLGDRVGESLSENLISFLLSIWCGTGSIGV